MRGESNVVPLRPVVYDGFTCKNCGEAWFQLIVTMDSHCRVTGFVTSAVCIDCGHLHVLEVRSDE